jgi:hypothetical protein
VTTNARSRVFVLSPASCAGQRARLLFSPGARFDLARALCTPTGAPLGQVFSFLSGLYFRGKLEYARTYARPPAGVPGVLVITSGAGLCAPEMPVQLDVLRHWAGIPIDTAEARYAGPLLRDAQALESSIRGSRGEVVLLGSVATGKYVDLLQQVFGPRLQFPAEFVGRGDMSRGGLLLRSARDRRELSYVPVTGSVRRGARPPRLVPRPGILGTGAAGPGTTPALELVRMRKQTPETPRKGPRRAGSNRALAREWTSLSVEEERTLLEAALADARERGDRDEVRRIEARLRLLDKGT